MDAKDFFDRLERFCANKPEKIGKDITNSPPSFFKDNCNLSEVIKFVEKL